MNSEFKPYLSVQSLESEFREVLARQRSQCRSRRWTKQIARSLLNFFTGQQTLSIRQKTIHNKTQWIAYDPQRNVRKVFETEHTLRVWIEQRDHL